VRYDVFIAREVHRSRTRLPGNVRQRVRHVIDGLAEDPRPGGSTLLDLAGLHVPSDVEVRRYRVDSWRIVYAINDQAHWVWVLALRRRPPYDYADLADLVARMQDDSND
jgi:mRNA interferase RelE/StbE